MLSIYANKPDGITKTLLTSKNFTNPVDVSVHTIMRGAKDVLKNGRKALACAKDFVSEYKSGTIPLLNKTSKKIVMSQQVFYVARSNM
jgi:hypothetical protein